MLLRISVISLMMFLFGCKDYTQRCKNCASDKNQFRIEKQLPKISKDWNLSTKNRVSCYWSNPKHKDNLNNNKASFKSISIWFDNQKAYYENYRFTNYVIDTVYDEEGSQHIDYQTLLVTYSYDSTLKNQWTFSTFNCNSCSELTYLRGDAFTITTANEILINWGLEPLIIID